MDCATKYTFQKKIILHVDFFLSAYLSPLALKFTFAMNSFPSCLKEVSVGCNSDEKQFLKKLKLSQAVEL